MFPVVALILGSGKGMSEKKQNYKPFQRNSRYLVLVRGDAGGGGQQDAELRRPGEDVKGPHVPRPRV